MGVIRMARPVRRKGSSIGQFRDRIPTDVIAQVRGTTLKIPVGAEVVVKRISSSAVEITLSLRSSDETVIRARHAQVTSHLENIYATLRTITPVKLTHKQSVALAGEFYRGWADMVDVERRSVKVSRKNEDGTWTSHIVEGGLIEADYDADDISAMFGVAAARLNAAPLPHEDANLKTRLVDFLRDRGIRADDSSMDLLAKEVRKAVQQAFELKQRNAAGDYSPDPKADRFPPLSVLQPATDTKSAAPRLTFDALLAAWKDHPEQKHRSQSTISSYAKALQKLKAFLKHSDATAVTRADIQRFADHRAEKVSLKTVNDSDLAAFKAVYAWAIRRDRHPGPNPAEGVRLTEGKQPSVRSDPGFTDAEAIAILKHASTYAPKSDREDRKMTAAKRWVPWLMAYSGVRVGEAAQLRKQDVRVHEGVQCAFIDYEAGTTKTKATWPIPLHPHLIELGFLEFVKSAPEGHLFLTPRPDLYDPAAPESRTKDPRGIFGPHQAVKNRLREIARLIVPRKEVSPNHGWRHRFKAKGLAYNIEERVLDAFQDHAARTVGRKYGDPFEAMVGALDKMPKYEVE